MTFITETRRFQLVFQHFSTCQQHFVRKLAAAGWRTPCQFFQRGFLLLLSHL
jgi:hypothetical protein